MVIRLVTNLDRNNPKLSGFSQWPRLLPLDRKTIAITRNYRM